MDGGDFVNYQWSSGESTKTIQVDEDGTYRLTVTDGNGCSGTTEVAVVVNALPISEITGQLSICTGESTELDAGPFSSYQWSTGATTQTINVTTGDSYQLTVTDASGCTGTSETTVIEHANPEPQIIGQLSICNEETTELDAGNFNTFSWSTGESTRGIQLNTSGIYQVTVTDQSGCMGEASVEVVAQNKLEPVISGEQVICIGETTELEAGDFLSYQWSTGDTSRTLQIETAGLYQLTVSDANGCSGSTEAEVQLNPLPIPQINGQLSVCTGESAVLDAGDFVEYIWSTGESSQMISVSAANSYGVTVTDQNGCIGSDQIDFRVDENLAPQITGNLSICSGEDALLDAGVFAGFNWSTGETTQSITTGQAGSYSVTVSDANGCTGVAEVLVASFEQPQLTIQGNTQLCFGTTSQLSAEGFASYSWSTGETSQSIVVATAQTFSLTVTDDNGCTATDDIQLEFAEEAMSIEEIQLCFGDFYEGFSYSQSTEIINSFPGANGCDSTHIVRINVSLPVALSLAVEEGCLNEGGTIAAVANGGTAPYNYMWEDGVTGGVRGALPEGNYTVTVTDANGCFASNSVDIGLMAGVEFEAAVSQVKCYEESNGAISLSINSGTAPYTIEWSTGDTLADLINLSAGDYSVLISDANECKRFSSFTINQPDSVSVQVNTSAAPNGNDGSATAIVTGGIAPYRYAWSNGGEGVTIENLSVGTYIVAVTDANDCLAVSSGVVDQVNAVAEWSNLQSLELIPNPSSGQFKLILQLKEAAQLDQIAIYNLLGQQLKSFPPIYGQSLNLDIDLSFAPPGSYFIVFRSRDHLISRHLVLVK